MSRLAFNLSERPAGHCSLAPPCRLPCVVSSTLVEMKGERKPLISPVAASNLLYLEEIKKILRQEICEAT